MTAAFPLIGVHGLNDNSRTWNSLRECGITIRGADMPWATVQGVPSDRVGIESAVQCLHDLNERAERAGPFGIIAHSFGAAVTLKYLASRPQSHNLRALILLCPSYVSMDEISRPRMHGIHRSRFNQIFTQRLLLNSGYVGNELAEHMARLVIRGVNDQDRFHVMRVVEDASMSCLEKIDIPTLLISGGIDPSFTASHRHELTTRLRRVTPVAVPNWSHFCHLEEPIAVSSLISRWAEETYTKNYQKETERYR